MSEAHDRFYRDMAGLVWLGGEDRLAFLQRMSTNRCADLVPGTGRATVLTDDSGRAVELLACHAGASGAALITTALEATATVAAQLRRYVMYQDRVTVTDASEQVRVLRLLGPNAVAAARQATGIDLVGAAAGDWRESGAASASIWAMRQVAPGGLAGVDLVLPVGEPVEAMVAGLLDAGLLEGGPSDYTGARIQAGLPAWGHEIDGRANPLELGLLELVDFDKGCYVGQEVVARLANYEKVQRRLVRFVAEGEAPEGAPVLPADPAQRATTRGQGRVTSIARAPDGRWRGLALVPLGLPDGAALELVDADRPVVRARIEAGIG
ncbi:MAG: hypothetical protein KDH92_06105 [Chloroflexi bacterium]|nr:hypothetical protein [Chloroflexota bacterium]